MSIDVSLDDELLQVTEKKGKVQKKAVTDKSHQEEGEVSGSEGDSDHKGGKRKPKSNNKKPIKKRKTDDSSDENSSDDEYNDGWGDDLMGDEADRAKLNAMPEIEREAILDERYQKRKELRDGLAVKRRLKEEQRSRDKEKKEGKDGKRETKESREIRDRTVRKQDTKGKALSELKKKRAKAGYKKSDSDDEVEDGEVDDSKDDDDDYAPKGVISDYDAGTTAKGKEEEDEGEEVVYHDDDEDQGHPVTLDDIEQLRLGRELLEKWLDKPFFNNLIPGFFVRIGIGMDPQTRMNVYRVAQIDSVASKSSYLMSGKQTTKWLKLLIGDKSKEFKMETISNRKFSESEYKHWKMQMERAVRAMPMSGEVKKKLETLATADDYRYTSDDIQKMLEEKKKSGVLPISVAAEKARLAIIRDTTSNAEERADLERKISQLDDLAKERAQKRVSTTSVFNINQRNKKINFDTAMESKSEERAGNSDLDPFSRRKTMPTIVYASKHKDEAEKPKDETHVTPALAATPATNGTAPNSASANTPSTATNSSSTDTSASSSTPANSSSNPLKISTGAAPVPGKTSEHDSIAIDIDFPLVPPSSSSTSSAPSSTPSFTTRPFPTHPVSTPTPTTPPFVPTEKKPNKSTLSLDDYMRRRRAME